MKIETTNMFYDYLKDDVLDFLRYYHLNKLVITGKLPELINYIQKFKFTYISEKPEMEKKPEKIKNDKINAKTLIKQNKIKGINFDNMEDVIPKKVEPSDKAILKKSLLDYPDDIQSALLYCLSTTIFFNEDFKSIFFEERKLNNVLLDLSSKYYFGYTN